MAAWKFTNVYGTGYPALENSILSVLVFDVPNGTSPISGDNFAATLDLTATGKAMNVLAAMLGMTSVPMSGTVTTTDAVLNVALTSTNNRAILSALAACIPLLGGKINSADLAIKNKTAASYTLDDAPEIDVFDLDAGINIGSGKGDVALQIPMSNGIFSINVNFSNFGISLADLNFLVPGSSFSTMFPTDLPTTYYNPATTALYLLSLGLTLCVNTSPSLSINVSTVSTSIGIVNIPLYPNALYLNPLAVQINVADPFSKPVASWGLTGDICLYPYGKQTSPPSVAPDFTYELAMQLPTASNPDFAVTGTFDNPENLPVSQILCDLMDNAAFNTGISKLLTLEKFDFAASANTSTGTIDDFSVEIAMSAEKNKGSFFGLFSSDFGVADFSIAVSYVK